MRYIYLILDSNNVPKYVGISFDPANRFLSHKRKHEWAVDCHIFVIDFVEDKDWKERERFWIAYYSQWYHLENIHSGGGSAYPVPEVVRLKIANTLKGRKLPAETRRKMSASHIGKSSPMKGMKNPALSKSLLEKRAIGWEPRLGKTHGNAARKNMSDAQKRYISEHPSHIQKLKERGRAGAVARWKENNHG